MSPLTSTHLLTLKLDVAFDAMVSIGQTPAGRRRIAPILGGTFDGERLRGKVEPGGADWVINRADGAMLVDVRILLTTDDGAAIYLTYQGAFHAAPEAMTRFNRGERLAEHDYTLRTVARFESGAQKYAWLNDVLAIGVGKQTAAGPVYDIFEIT